MCRSIKSNRINRIDRFLWPIQSVVTQSRTKAPKVLITEAAAAPSQFIWYLMIFAANINE